MSLTEGYFQPTIKSQFFEDHNKDISFFYTGKNNVLGRDYADAIIANVRNAHYIKIGTISFDTSLQSSDENIIHEEFLLRTENYLSSQYLANEVSVKIAGHIIGKRVDKNKFKCIITPEIDYLDIPKIMITEDVYGTDDSITMSTKIGIWLHTEGIKRIYITKLYSHARNSYPVNDEYIDSKYYIEFLKNSDMVYDVDTTNILANITRKQFAAGVSIYTGIDTRLKKIESIKYPDIKYACINTDSSWVPITEGAESIGYQKIPLVNADYSDAGSNPFIGINTSTRGFSVNEEGLYQVQYTCGISTLSAIHDSDIEVSMFKNNDIVSGTTIIKKLKGGLEDDTYTNDYGMASGTVLLHLKSSDIIHIQFKFLSGYNGGVVNKGTKVLVTKLLQMV